MTSYDIKMPVVAIRCKPATTSIWPYSSLHVGQYARLLKQQLHLVQTFSTPGYSICISTFKVPPYSWIRYALLYRAS